MRYYNIEDSEKRITLLSNLLEEVKKATIHEDDNFEILEIFNSIGAFQMSSKMQEVNVKSLS